MFFPTRTIHFLKEAAFFLKINFDNITAAFGPRMVSPAYVDLSGGDRQVCGMLNRYENRIREDVNIRACT